MNKEDYFKYYIQGSDHYLLPKDIFNELFQEMINWKEETQQLKTIEKEHQRINGELREEVNELKQVNNYSKRHLFKINKERLEANLQLVNKNKKLQAKSDKYKCRIDKAIKIIEDVLNIWETKPNEIATLDLKELLEILKGSDSNE